MARHRSEIAHQTAQRMHQHRVSNAPVPVSAPAAISSHLPPHNLHNADVLASPVPASAPPPAFVEDISSSSAGLDPRISDIRVLPGSYPRTFAEGQVAEVMLRLKKPDHGVDTRNLRAYAEDEDEDPMASEFVLDSDELFETARLLEELARTTESATFRPWPSKSVRIS
jgi:hypothetical protein